MTITADDLRIRIDRLPREAVASRPTPLERAPRLGSAIGCGEFLIKRDDLTGLAFGGNKARELDFLMGEALATGCDVFVAGGGAGQSNHARQCAAAATKVGLEPVLVLRGRGDDDPPIGNLLVVQALGARISWVEVDPDINDREATSDAMEAISAALVAEGRHPYVLRSSFHPLAAVAYVECVLELITQIEPTEPLTVWVTSLGATHVGLALGIRLLGLPWRVVGAAWRPAPAGLQDRLAELADATANLLGLDDPARPSEFVTIDCGGPRYAVSSRESREAFTLAATSAGLLLDPVYTAKGMAALIAECRAGRIDEDEKVVFIHTGGLPAMFAYPKDVLAAGSSAP